VRNRRVPEDVSKDVRHGVAIGAAGGVLLALFALLLNATTGRGVEERYGVGMAALAAAYIVGGTGAGAVGGMLRPLLDRVIGQAALCFGVAFCLYSAASAVMPGDIFGSPLVDGVVIAAFATPIWLLVVRLNARIQSDLHDAAGIPQANSTETASPPDELAGSS
jgi:hypothetical protein